MWKYSLKLLLFLSILIISWLGVEFFLKYSLKVVKGSTHRTLTKVELLFEEVDSNSVLIVGDSRLEWGINPKTLDSALNGAGTTINLAMPGSSGSDVLGYCIDHKVYPRMVIIGYTPFLGFYAPFNFEEAAYQLPMFNEIHKFNIKIEDYLSRNFFLFEDGYQSLKLYAEGKHPHFIRHRYDNYGGVVVDEWEKDFKERCNFQIKYYNSYKTKFDLNKQKEAVALLNSKLKELKKHNTLVVLLRMPVVDTIRRIEDIHNPMLEIEADYFIDCVNPENSTLNFPFHLFQPPAIREKEVFIDGSHLKPEYSHTFSRTLGKTLKNL